MPNKINYLRKCFVEKYNENDLKSAAEIGEILLREHWHIKSMKTIGYSNDLFNLAYVHDELGNTERAAELYSDSARQMSEKDSETLPFAERINNMAVAFNKMGMDDPAFCMFKTVSSIRRRILGSSSPIYADSVYNMANAAMDIGRTKEARKYHEEALQIRENEGHTDDIINSLHSLAFLHESEAEYEKAVSYAETAIKYSSHDNKVYASSCNYLAGLYESIKRYDAALLLYDEVLDVTSIQIGREHSSYLNVAMRRANVLSLLNRTQESLEAYESVCETFARVSGTKHIFYANCLRGMAMLHKTLEDPARAEECIMEAMKIRRKMYEDITLDVTFLINLHIKENNHDKALEALIYALMCSGGDSPEFAEMLDNLTQVFTQAESTTTIELMNMIEMLNNREKIHPILKKWEAWERI
ncbi:MAG: tetratricopeptide repeat protein [Defluviitaleaceae bacterium]|nr:tetratricopeptide repeat protein [Defluviitaleaceae bacterium]